MGAWEPKSAASQHPAVTHHTAGGKQRDNAAGHFCVFWQSYTLKIWTLFYHREFF